MLLRVHVEDKIIRWDAIIYVVLCLEMYYYSTSKPPSPKDFILRRARILIFLQTYSWTPGDDGGLSKRITAYSIHFYFFENRTYIFKTNQGKIQRERDSLRFVRSGLSVLRFFELCIEVNIRL